MSLARKQFLSDLEGLTEAVSLDPIAAGATSTVEAPGIVVLRRGILIAALIALETFVRDRTTELLETLARWPARFEDLPQRLRDASLLNALTNIQRYALMLKRQKENYEGEILDQIAKMAASRGPTFAFTKFVSGDYTGNISEESFKSLLSNFQVEDCWSSFRTFSSDIGFGVPSVSELLSDIVRKRHRSAHAAGFVPTAADISSLSANLFCLGLCFDTAMTTSVEQALVDWKRWAEKGCRWRDSLDIYFIDYHGTRFRLSKHGRSRALHVLKEIHEAKGRVPRPMPGRVAILITRDQSNRPKSWSLL